MKLKEKEFLRLRKRNFSKIFIFRLIVKIITDMLYYNMDKDDEYISTSAKSMVQEVRRHIEDQRKYAGEEIAHDVCMHFLAGLIAAEVFDVMKDGKNKGKSKKDKGYSEVMSNFLAIKLDVQNAVACGFQGAMQTFSGKDLEYYCLIKTVTQNTNKEPC